MSVIGYDDDGGRYCIECHPGYGGHGGADVPMGGALLSIQLNGRHPVCDCCLRHLETVAGRRIMDESVDVQRERHDSCDCEETGGLDNMSATNREAMQQLASDEYLERVGLD